MRHLKGVVEGAVLWACVATVPACSGTPNGEGCDRDDECRSGSACLYPIAELCGATRTCQPLPTGPMCAHDIAYCDCVGNLVSVGVCHLPNGYADVRIGGSALAGPCPSGMVAVGTPCTDRAQCGVSQVCAFPVDAGCAAQGTCQPEPFSRGCSANSPTFCGCGANAARTVIAECAAPDGMATEPVSGARPTTGCSAPGAAD